MKFHTTIRRDLALRVGATVLLGGYLISAEAQSQGQAQQDAGQNQPRASNELEEVVVTAQKRREGLQNVPIAITAVEGATLEKAGVTELGDLVQLAPSLQFGTRSTNVFIAMRGISQAGQDIGSQSGVTVSLDGVPLLNHFMMNPSFLDVERVEILRGPQGTLQGRNATGGAINISSLAPTNTLDGALELTGGNYSRYGLKGFINVPLSDKVSSRLSIQHERADGWMKNSFLGTRNDDTNIDRVRGQMLFTPTDRLSVRALLDYTRDRSDPSFAVLLGRADPNIPTVAELPTYGFPPNDLEHLTFYIDQPNLRDVESLRATAIATLQLGETAALVSTSGYIKHDIDLTQIDVDATPNPVSDFSLIGIYNKQLTQEFTFTTDLGSRADLVAGLFYMKGDSSEPLYLDFTPITNYLVYLPVEKLDSYAAYTQFRYKLTDKLRATLGGRYTSDRKSYEMDATVLTFHTLLADEDKWDAFTPRFVLDYTPSDESLIYASASRGFKSGGFNTLGDITLPVDTFEPEFVWNYEAGAKAMLLDRRLRLGLTGFYANYSHLQATVFRVNPLTQVRFPRVENSASAKIKGVELEIAATPVTGLNLSGAVTRLDAKYGRFCNNDPLFPNVPTDPECASLGLPSGAINLEGNTLTQAPKWQFNVSGGYSFPLTERLEMTARADYKWQSRVQFDFYNHPTNTEDAYGLLNASLSVGPPSLRWALTAWVRNAFDERYVTQANTASGANPSRSGSLGMPRMFGATLNWRL
jgi:iron complex outermembrane receptor protein